MFGWITKKLKAWRISNSIAQLAHELGELSDAEVALVLVTAMGFSSSLADEGGQGALIARAIEMPNSLSEEDAYALYWNLEDILMAGQKQNEAAFSTAKERMGAKFADNFRKDMKLMEIAIRLLLSRIAVSIDRKNKSKLQAIARRLDVGIPLINEATKRLRFQHSVIGDTKTDEYYAGVDTSARLYAFSYMASFYGAKSTQP